MTTAQASADALERPIVSLGRDFTSALVFYAAYVLAVCVLLWPTLWEMVRTWATSSSYHHGFLVAPLALWMAWRSTPIGAAIRPSPLALGALLIAAATWLAGHAAGVNLIEQIGFVSLLIAGAAVCFGAAQFRHWLFPLTFLYFMVPFGGALLPFLQSMTASAAVGLLKLSGVAASLEGLLVTTPAGSYRIAEACAGLNFLLAALMVAAVYSRMAFSSSRKIAAFLAFAVALALVANVLRAYLVILGATVTGGRYTIGEDHIVFGWVFYGLLLFALIAVGRRFADLAAPRCRAASAIAPPGVNPISIGTIAVAFATVVSTAAYARFVVDRAPAYELPASLPVMNAPGWRVGAPFPSWAASLDHADRSVHASYQSRTVSVQLALGYFAYDRQGAEIAGYATRPEGETWRRVRLRAIPARAFGEQRNVPVETLESPWGDRLDVAVLYWLGDAVFADPRALKVQQARERLAGKTSRGGVIFIAAPSVSELGGAPAIEAFLDSAEPLATWLARVDAKLSN